MSQSIQTLHLVIIAALTTSSGCGFTPPCRDSKPILDRDGDRTGFERCKDGTIHRASIVAPDGLGDRGRCEGWEEDRYCETDADCTEAPAGACLQSRYPDDGTSTCICADGCLSDADCQANEICLPPGIVRGSGPIPTCVAASCSQDADCASEQCGVSSWYDGCSHTVVALSCRSREDECRTTDDCGGDKESCGLAGPRQAHWTCNLTDCDV